MEQKDFRHLPEPVRLEDTVTSEDIVPVHDPEGERDTAQEFLLRYFA